MNIDLTIHIGLVAAGSLLLLVAIFGRAKGFTVEIAAQTASRATRWLIGLLGFALLSASIGLYWIRYFGPVRIDSVEARWDAASANACGGKAPYTIQLTTSGSGQRSLGYTVRVEDNSWIGSVDVTTPGTVFDKVTVDLNYAFQDLPRDVYLRVDLGDGRTAVSAAPLHLTCNESADVLMQRLQKFFDSYRSEVLASGRSGPAVTHYYYEYPLNWYGHRFESEADYVDYVNGGHRPSPPVPTSPTGSPSPSVSASPAPPSDLPSSTSTPRCQFSNGRV